MQTLISHICYGYYFYYFEKENTNILFESNKKNWR